jgi:hypothetical protein
MMQVEERSLPPYGANTELSRISYQPERKNWIA